MQRQEGLKQTKGRRYKVRARPRVHHGAQPGKPLASGKLFRTTTLSKNSTHMIIPKLTRVFSFPTVSEVIESLVHLSPSSWMTWEHTCAHTLGHTPSSMERPQATQRMRVCRSHLQTKQVPCPPSRLPRPIPWTVGIFLPISSGRTGRQSHRLAKTCWAPKWHQTHCHITG